MATHLIKRLIFLVAGTLVTTQGFSQEIPAPTTPQAETPAENPAETQNAAPTEAQNVTPPEEEEQAPSKEMLESSLHALVQGSNAFGFEIYNILKNTPGNMCFSPYCITSSLAIPFVGSKGSTQVEMRSVMHFLTQVNILNRVYSILDKLYTTPWYLGPNECKVFLANALWVQRDFIILPTFLETVTTYYKSSVKQTDFIRNPDGARSNINNWVREQTQGRIPEEIPRGGIDSSTNLLSVGAIFLKAVWDRPFDPKVTKGTSFFIDPLTTAAVEMMTIAGSFRLYQGDTFNMLELPYRPSYLGVPKLAFLCILPNSNFGLAQLEAKFTHIAVDTWIAAMQEAPVFASIPKFRFHDTYELGRLLRGLGMQYAFSDQADFSGISTTGSLSLSKIVHDTYISIDETGSDVISATSIPLNDNLPPSTSPIFFKADHAFLFLIIDKINNTILYMGRYTNPN